MELILQNHRTDFSEKVRDLEHGKKLVRDYTHDYPGGEFRLVKRIKKNDGKGTVKESVVFCHYDVIQEDHDARMARIDRY